VPSHAPQVPFPASQVPFLASQVPFPASQVPFLASQVPFPASQVPFPASQVPFLASQVPFLGLCSKKPPCAARDPERFGLIHISYLRAMTKLPPIVKPAVPADRYVVLTLQQLTDGTADAHVSYYDTWEITLGYLMTVRAKGQSALYAHGIDPAALVGPTAGAVASPWCVDAMQELVDDGVLDEETANRVLAHRLGKIREAGLRGIDVQGECFCGRRPVVGPEGPQPMKHEPDCEWERLFDGKLEAIRVKPARR
jgi:hypothetical protein